MRLAVLLPFVLVVVACRGASSTPRCFQNGDPPPATVPGGKLLAREDARCPKEPPARDGACNLSLAAPNARNEERSDVSCHYAAPLRGPCEVDSCQCVRVAPGTTAHWECDHVWVE